MQRIDAGYFCSINFTPQFGFESTGQPTAAILLITYPPPVSLPLFQSCHNHRYPMLIRLTLATLIFCITMIAARGATTEILFETDIKPLFTTKCGKCHREDERKGGLDLSSMQAIHNGGETGDDLLSTALDESALWQQIENGDMPPEGEPPLTQQEQLLVQSWILAGSPSKTSIVKRRKLSQHDVLPIFLLRCNACHGPRLQQGGLDLRTHTGMLRGGNSGPALVPGDPDKSLLIQRIESQACPPSESLLKFFVRRPSSAEVTLLRDWITAEAPAGDLKPDVATTAPDPLVSQSDREHWAFQPPRWPDSGNSVDDFVSQKLRNAGLNWSPPAQRSTLIRRVYLDLLGLPPELDDLQQWLTSTDPNWYSKMIDHVLASPRYGERWGRYWLDLAGYADSEGGTSADPLRPVAWKYRDYVIRSFNEDKPYDVFLVEQLAGDELVGLAQNSTASSDTIDQLVATGFLRMGIDETGSRTMNFVPERLKVVADALSVVSSGLMGLTMECARCHSHKYDPIPQRDYYRLKAVFQGALDEHDWSSFKQRKLNVATQEHLTRIAEVNPPLEKQQKALLARQKRVETEIRLNLLRYHYPDQSEADNQTTLRALKKADNTRTLPEKKLVERLQEAELFSETRQPATVLNNRSEAEQIKKQLHRLRQRMIPPQTVRALWDMGRPSPTYVLRRGEHDKPGTLVGPGVPTVLTDGKTPFQVTPVKAAAQVGTHTTTGRRIAFARWLTQADHPLTARVMVNRIFARHFGTGLAADLGNFGRQAEPPSHPQLLDWLSLKFIQSGWSIKAMHRLMMNSKTYQQSSRVTDQHQKIDSRNRLLARMPLQRLDAEALRDSLLFVSGRLSLAAGGVPDAVSVDRDGLVSVYPSYSSEPEQVTSRTPDKTTSSDFEQTLTASYWRRSIYLQYRRTEIATMMDTFDYPQMGPNCLERPVSTVSPQALMLLNDKHVHDLAQSFADRILSIIETRNLDKNNRTKVDLIYRTAFSRSASHGELELGDQTLRKLELAWRGNSSQALATYCHTIFNTAAFLYVD